jgi:4-hydroxyphenylpyruvate dioxygenase
MESTRFTFNTGNLVGSIVAKLAAIEEAGFSATTLWPADIFAHFEDADANLGVLRQSRVRTPCYMMVRDLEGSPPEVKERKLELARQMMDQMALVGADTLVQCSNINTDIDRDWGRAVQDLQRLGELARSKGVRIAFEPMSQGDWINTYQLGWELVRDVDHPNIGLVIDASHIFLAESPLDGIDRIPAERIFLVELADLPATQLGRREMLRNYRLFPGEGSRPVRALVERILGTGYRGPISAEVFNAYYRTLDPRDVARRGFESLERLFARELTS